ncbi:MAG: hypothetical protein PHI55_11415 [Burkholderiaceae bacterium]|nr:hypothetical protein [Burkholderiaceae bacterium]
MPKDPELFADPGPEFSPQPDRLEVVAGKVVATMQQPSAAQKRFNTLMDKLQAEQGLADTLRQALDSQAPLHRQALREASDERQRLCRQMAFLLDAHLQAPSPSKGLTPTQKQQAQHLLGTLIAQLAPASDPELQALIARHAPDGADGDADAAESAQQQAQELLDTFAGADFAQGRTFERPEDVIRAALEYEQAQAEKREAKRAARKAKKPPTARELAAQQKELDAQTALRTVFRQLASALHPDREPDEALRARKTTLMSQVNAAYERKDLSALLRIQLESEMLDAAKASALSEARLKAMCDVLAQQLKTLQQENGELRRGMEYEFGYPSHLRFNAKDWRATLQAALQDQQDALHQMRADLDAVQDAKALKSWLKSQVKVRKVRAQEVTLLDDIEAMLDRMARGGRY